MRGYLVFTKKELVENLRNYKLLCMLAVFLIFGFISPLTAKFTPELLSALAPEFSIALNEPTAMDSWTQFYKNISSIGMSLALIIFCSLLSSEYSKGTLTIMLTKGLSRPAVILSKFTGSLIIFTICIWSSFLLTYVYTMYFWPEAVISHIAFATLSMWIVGVMYFSVLILGCVLFKSGFGSIIFFFIITTAMSLLAIPKHIGRYSPANLSSKSMDLLSGTMAASEFVAPIIVALVISIISVLGAMVLFNKKQI